MKKRSEARAEKDTASSDRSDATEAKADEAPAEAAPPPAESSKAIMPPGSPFDFPNANKARTSPLRPDLAKVVETIFVRDIHAEWKALEEGLELGEKRSEHGHAVAALDKAAPRAYRAHRLYLTARAARESWEAENAVIFGAMVSEATRSLQKEKEDGIRNKAITDADVQARVATLFPDAYRAQEDRRRAIEFTVKSLERLAEIWMGKCRDLQAVVGKLRG